MYEGLDITNQSERTAHEDNKVTQSTYNNNTQILGF